MNSSTLVGNPNVMVAGPPPPPPPPPPVSGHVPAMRLNTAENAAAKRPQAVSNDAYEPPAAIQNAMLTKDKKPFTYTPGMGGKLDLSQIRSPRMARRVAKNANDEGIEGPPKSAIEPKQSPAVSPASNLLMPQVAVPVFPTNMPPPQPPHRMSQSPSVNRTLSNVADKQAEPARNIMKVDTKVAPITVTSSQSSTPESPGTPTQVTLTKAPTPWMQNKIKPQEELPEWAKRTNAKTAGSDPSEDAFSYVQVQQPTSPQQARPKQEQKQYSMPQSTPQQTRPQQLFQQPQQQRRNADSVAPQQTNSQSYNERVVPIRIEDRPSVFDVKRDSGHHQFKQPPTLHHQQRWGQVPAQHTSENQAQTHPQNQKPSQIHVISRPEQSVGTYIIPIVVEGSEKRAMPSNTDNNIKIGKPARVVQPRSPDIIQQQEPGPIQSRSFRVLQKITDTDEPNDVGSEQIRRMELSEDEKILMNKFKEQVDHETYLHQEKDPRYRGAAIPSRAFRFLQNMTESNDTSVCAAPQNVANKRQNRNSKSFEETQANLPPSEQQVPEPKKYMGSAIPSRSFRILQAMTASENDATQENRQADYTCRTENNLPGNQQDAYFSPRPVSFWSHSDGWWGYYPVPYNAPSNKPANEADERSFPYLRYPDENACVGYEFFYPVYGENLADVARTRDRENSSGNQYGYVAVFCPQAAPNDARSNNCVRSRCTHSPPARDDRYPVHEVGSAGDESGDHTLPDEINHLDAQSGGNAYESGDKNCLMTAMNIVDEDDGPGETVISNNIEKSRKSFGLHVSVPNYTYMDTSDSSDSSDSISDNERFADSRRKYRDDTTSNNTLSSSDSDSYEGYSVGPSPYEKLKGKPVPSDKSRADPTGCPINNSVDNSPDDSENRISPKNRIDYSNDGDSCATLNLATRAAPEERNEEGNLDSCSGRNENSVGDSEPNTGRCGQETDPVVPHQLSTIYEDAERPSSEGLRSESKGWDDGGGEASLGAIDDSPDDTEATMVSVSLPLRFRFSVSEDNEDVTTVTVGNSEIRAERSRGGCSARGDDVRVNFHIGNDTSVDFTVRRHAPGARDEAGAEAAVPHVDFTLKKESTAGTDREEPPVPGTNFEESASENDDRSTESAAPDLSGNDGDSRTESVGSRLVASERSWTRDCETLRVPVADASQKNCCAIADKNDDPELSQTDAKYLPGVQDSREDTDDEDSGVTSDTSRMISELDAECREIDTDSECAASKNRKKYQRTQTHSRLFRLLNPSLSDDSNLSDCGDPGSRKGCLSLPLETHAFNYDDSYCSNYSSGLTSPEYSPVHEQSCRKFHDAGLPEQVPPYDDSYFLSWKSTKLPNSHDEHDVVPSLAFKILNSKVPLWTYKVNVLCPRIKSTKSVPQALLARQELDKN